ncbi:MAG TPA: hypothetical protein VEI96_08645 [Thermodesulfovibrionales bacterium]|nr:hypothetical protein [Thermodesulfovibrionales bacterium]
MTAEEGHRVRGTISSLAVGPFLGLLYAIALPFIGIATIAALIGRKVLGGVFSLVGNLATFGWRPLESHLGGKKRRKETPK